MRGDARASSLTALVLLSLLAGCGAERGADAPPREANGGTPSLVELQEQALADLDEDSRWTALLRACRRNEARCAGPLSAELRVLIADDVLATTAALRLAQVEHALGERAEARAAYDLALELAQRRGDPCLEVRPRYLRSSLVEDPSEREVELITAADLADRCGMAHYADYAANKLALVYRSEGRYHEEKQQLDRLLRGTGQTAEEEGGIQRWASLTLRLADWSRRSGRLDEAARRVEDVLEPLGRHGSMGTLAQALMQLGVIDIDRSRYRSARGRLLEAVEAAEAAGSARLSRIAKVLAALAHLRAGAPEEALEELQHVSSEMPEDDDHATLASLIFQGEALRELGRLEESARCYRRVLDRPRVGARREVEWEARTGLAETLLELGDSADALAEARSAVAVIEELREGIDAGPKDDLNRFLGFRANAFTVLALASVASTPEDLSEAFSVVESSHARTLRESIAARDRSRAGAGDFPAITLSQFQERLAPGELYVAYQLGERSSLLLAVGRREASAHTLPPRGDLARAVGNYLRRLEEPATQVVPADAPAPSIEALVAGGAELARTLLGPISSRLAEAERLLISPDRVLHRLPFEALPSDAALARRGADAAFLGLNRTVSYLPSASFLRPETHRSFERIVLAAKGDAWPEFGLPELEGVSEEAQAIEGHYAALGKTIVDARGTHPEELAASLEEGADVLHLATHALVLPKEGPRILLGRDPGSGTPIVLDTERITALSRAPRLVVLSACDTATGDILGGEGVLSLVRAFNLAGTRNVVASLWPVDDGAAARTMVAFHRELTRGSPPASALYRARRTLHEEGHEHPYFWSAFVLYGPD